MIKSTYRKILAFGFAVTIISTVLVTAVHYAYFHKLEVRELAGIAAAVAAVLIFSAVCSAFVSHKITKSIIDPINNLADNLDDIENTEIDRKLKPFANALSVQRKKEKALNEQKKQFTANLSHELKTPLTSIAGYAELIETGIAREEDVPAFAKTIRKQALRLVSLSEDIIRLSQLEENDESNSISISSVDLYQIAQNCVNALQINAKLRGIEIILTGENTFVRGNAALLEELLYNLVDNAIRYNKDNGKIFVTVKSEDSQIALSVKDTGIGIEEKYHDRIFERFFRVDKSRSKATGGTGLGLAIVKHIAKLHDADLEIDSKTGKGTEISVFFKK